MKGYFQFEIITKKQDVALPASLEYLCYGSKAIINRFFFQCVNRL